MSDYNNNVFINCPFDSNYKPIFDAIVFSVIHCGFYARCARDEDDASEIRMEKLYRIISNCKYGIHDISRTEIDEDTGLPRFNMTYELGVFIGARKYGSKIQKKKKCLILDKDPYRYRKYISDISGQDIGSHYNDPDKAIAKVRNWLRTASERVTIPSPTVIINRYREFIEELPTMCRDSDLYVQELIFVDYTWLVTEFFAAYEK